ncbi:TonB-dependent receptor [Sphingosinithalassobacter portus]|uniref:TonB-dependent receptor n=1 Tax=Stakelama portus TaxID=2676234 RepID=UPI001EFD5E22|nr:TonB-dependent receptor [Sphingosinithalassobacter portus]
MIAASPAQATATTMRVDTPAGRAGDAAAILARQLGVSIVIPDPRVANRRVAAIRGRMSAREAVERLARAAGATAIAAGPGGWRLVDAPPPRREIRPAPARPAAPPQPVVLPEIEQPEIIVTASKRDSLLADYAGQVARVDGSDLAFGSVGGSDRIVSQVATVTSTHLGSGRDKLFIRGIADSSFTGPTQATVGMYLGDLRLNYNAADPDLRLSDMASVEVLEGPQGTLYGAGSVGGIIRLIPNPPDLGSTVVTGTLGGTATQHGAPGGDISLTANLPLQRDRAALRVTFGAERQGGYIDKPLIGRDDVNRTDIVGGRAMLRVALGDVWTLDLLGVGQRTRGADSQYADRDGPPLTRSSSVGEGFSADYGQAQLVLSGQLGSVRLRSSTGLVGQSLEERYDATLLDGAPRLFRQNRHTRMIANETRLWQPLDTRFGWLAGVSYTHNESRLTRKLGSVFLQSPTTGVENVIDEFTAYGEASVRLNPAVVATVGGRWTRSLLGGSGEDVLAAIALARADITAQRTETAFLPSASLLARLDPDLSVYIRYQQGFRPGGLAVEGEFVRRYRNDRIATLEFGVRHGRAGAGPFDIAASISYTDWRDIQADFVDGQGFPSTANVGDGHIWTGTLSGGVALTPSLRLDAGLIYNHSRVDQPAAGMLPMLRIDEVPNIARIVGRFGFDYRRPLGGDLNLEAKGWARYVGPSRLGIGPELGARQGNYLDSGVTVRVGSARLGVSASVTNLTDTIGNRFALGTPFSIGRDQITPLRPRSFRLGIDAGF